MSEPTPQKKLIIELSGENLLVDSSLEAYAYQTGYQDTVHDDQGNPITNPITKLDHAREQFMAYFRSVVQVYQIKQAQTLAAQQAAATVEASLDQMGIEVIEE